MDFLQKQVAGMLKSSISNFFEHKIKPLDLDADGQKDVDEMVVHSHTIVDGCQEAIAGADISQIMAGGSAIGQGVQTILKAVNTEKLIAGAQKSSGAVQELIKLAGLYIARFAPKQLAEEPALIEQKTEQEGQTA